MRKVITKKIIDLVPGDYPENILEVELIYDSGNPTILGWKGRPRGYYLTVSVSERFTPAGSDVPLIKHELGKWKYQLILEVSRQSKSAEKKAISLAEQKETELIQYVCEYYCLTLARTTAEQEVV